MNAWIGQIQSDRRMWLRTTSIGVRARNIDTPIKMQGAIWVDINIQRLEAGGGVDKPNLSGLKEVVGHDDMFLVWRCSVARWLAEFRLGPQAASRFEGRRYQARRCGFRL